MDQWANQPISKNLNVTLVKDGSGDDWLTFYDCINHEAVELTAINDFQSIAFAIIRPDTPPYYVRFHEALHFVKGEGAARRDVYHFVTRNHCKALRAGLTLHHSAFSSTPHPFETNPELGFEEAFFFLLPKGGKGLLEGEGVWHDGTKVDAAWPVRHRQLAQVPMGWHRVTALAQEDGAAPPLGYIWGYLALHQHWEKD